MFKFFVFHRDLRDLKITLIKFLIQLSILKIPSKTNRTFDLFYPNQNVRIYAFGTFPLDCKNRDTQKKK